MVEQSAGGQGAVGAVREGEAGRIRREVARNLALRERNYRRDLEDLAPVAEGNAKPNPQFIRSLVSGYAALALWARTQDYLDNGREDPVYFGVDERCPETDDPAQALANLLAGVPAPTRGSAEIRPMAILFKDLEMEEYRDWSQRIREILRQDPDPAAPAPTSVPPAQDPTPES
jgi:hypothetical protein